MRWRTALAVLALLALTSSASAQTAPAGSDSFAGAADVRATVAAMASASLPAPPAHSPTGDVFLIPAACRPSSA